MIKEEKSQDSKNPQTSKNTKNTSDTCTQTPNNIWEKIGSEAWDVTKPVVAGFLAYKLSKLR